MVLLETKLFTSHGRKILLSYLSFKWRRKVFIKKKWIKRKPGWIQGDSGETFCESGQAMDDDA